MKNVCTDRGFEDLLGYVDVKLQDASGTEQALVICKLKLASAE